MSTASLICRGTSLFDIFYRTSMRSDLYCTVKKIPMRCNMDADCVRRALRLLLHYECILIADAFIFSNIYELITDRVSASDMPTLTSL